MSDTPIFISGHGNAAKITALSLCAAGFAVRLDPTSPSATPDMPDWQNVLALSPAARRMLEVLGVWAALDQPSAPVTNMEVYAKRPQKQRGLFSGKLSFATPPEEPTEDDDAAIEVMAHIVSLASLSRAIEICFDTVVQAGACQILPHAIASHDPDNKTVRLEDGTAHACRLLLDHARAEKSWRRDIPRQQHDYGVSALTAELTSSTGHGGIAQQIFSRDGTLALLPLPRADGYALVWSLPQARAEALKHAGPEIVAYELNKATGGQFGDIRVDSAIASQPLSMRLTQDFVAPGLALLGDSAHITHPLAGQGFNLSLRDAAELADTLFEGRSLGLGPDDFSLLEDYQTKRRSDASLTIATTHSLHRLFATRHTSLSAMARLGMGLTDTLGERLPSLKRFFAAQADHGASPPPRLMRGQSFTD